MGVVGTIFFVDIKVSDTPGFISTLAPFLSLSKTIEDYSKPFGNCSSVASSSVAEDWADAPPVAMLELT